MHFLAGFGQRDFVAACGSVWTWDDVSWPDEKQAIGHYLLALIIMTSTSLDANFLSQKKFFGRGFLYQFAYFSRFQLFFLRQKRTEEEVKPIRHKKAKLFPFSLLFTLYLWKVVPKVAKIIYLQLKNIDGTLNMLLHLRF